MFHEVYFITMYFVMMYMYVLIKHFMMKLTYFYIFLTTSIIMANHNYKAFPLNCFVFFHFNSDIAVTFSLNQSCIKRKNRKQMSNNSFYRFLPMWSIALHA